MCLDFYMQNGSSTDLTNGKNGIRTFGLTWTKNQESLCDLFWTAQKRILCEKAIIKMQVDRYPLTIIID